MPGKLDPCARREVRRARQPHGQRFAASAASDDRVGAEVFDVLHGRRQPFGADANVFRAYAEQQAVRRMPRERDDVHRRGADEACGERRRGAVVESLGRAVLLDPSVAQKDHLVGHRHRLGLVVRHVHHGDAELALQRTDLAPHLEAQLRVEVRKRLVHQAQRSLGDDRATQRDPLLLPAGELRRLALEKALQAEQGSHARQARCALHSRYAAHRKPEDDILRHGQVRKERVGLEHHRHAALRRSEIGDVGIADPHPPARHLLEPRDEAQGRRFTATGRPQQHHERAGRGLEAHAVDRTRLAPGLDHIAQRDCRQPFISPLVLRDLKAQVRAAPLDLYWREDQNGAA